MSAQLHWRAASPARNTRVRLAWLLLFQLGGCAASDDDNESHANAADLYRIQWPSPEAGFLANGTWVAEHRWDDRVG